MDISKSVHYKTPDGVVREIRHGSGAMRRIQERFGSDIGTAIDKHGMGILPELLYLCMFDFRGKPPEGIDLEVFLESTPQSLLPEMFASLLSAVTEGKAEKNALEAPLKRALEEQEKRINELIGSISGPLPANASDSQATNSGGSQNGNSSHSATDIENSETLKIPASA